jgi:hypothetical protein
MRYGPGEQAIMKDAIKWIGAQAPWRRTDERASAPDQQAWIARLQRVGAEERKVGLTAARIREIRLQAAEILARAAAGPSADTVGEFLARIVRQARRTRQSFPRSAWALPAITVLLALGLYLAPDAADPRAKRRTPDIAWAGAERIERAADLLQARLARDIDRFQERHFATSERGAAREFSRLRQSMEQTVRGVSNELNAFARDSLDATGGSVL